MLTRWALLLLVASATLEANASLTYRFTFTGIRDAPMKGDGIALSEVQLVTASGTTAAIQSAENPGACGVDSFVIKRTSASCYTLRAPALR